MRAIRSYCCSCNVLTDVFHVEGEGNLDCLSDRCDACVETQSQEAKKPWKRVPKLGVIVNDSESFNRLMNDRKVQNQPKKRAKR